MADEDRGNSIRQEIPRNDIVSTIIAQLDTTLGSKMGELIRLMGEINDRDKRERAKSDSSSSFRRGSLDSLVSDFKSAGKTLKDFEKSIGSASEAVSSQRDKWNRQMTYSGETGVKKVYSAKMAKITADIENELADLAERTREKVKEAEAEWTTLYGKAKEQKLSYIESLQSEIEQLDSEIKTASSNRKKRELEDAKLQKEREIEYTKTELDRIEKPKKDKITKITSSSSQETDALLRKLRESRDKLDQEYSVLSDAIEDAISSSNSLRGSSQYFSQFSKTPEDEETEFDKLSREIEKQKDLWLSALQAIDKRIKEDETLTDIERDNLLKQREYINKQIDLSNKWTPAREQFSKSVKTLGDAAKNIISSIGKTVLKRFEDYYLNSYKESFQKVYDSVENTRNTVSARLKLDQGGFSDLQSEIQNEIEELGIESSVTQADVNDALVSLQAAGVTDKDMLKTLAIEQAKLIASGSSLNLGNEETIQNLRQIYQQQLQATGDQQEALNNLSSLIQTAGTAQSAIGASGWDSSLVNGGADRLFNQVANIGITAGKSIEQMSSDLTAAFATSEHMYGIGQDPDAIYSLVNDIINKSVGDYSTLEKILLTSNEISRDALLDSNASLEKNYQDIYSAMKDILQSGTEGDKKYLAEVLSAYGFDMSPEQAVKFMEAADAIRVPTEAEMKQAEAIDKQAREQGTFLSETQKHLNEAQNTMTEVAISAEKLYKGNDYVLEGFNAVETGLNAIEEVAKNILASMWTNSGTGRAVSSFNLTPEMAKDFAFGTKGTTAGAIGKGASIAVGAGMIGYSVIDTIKEHNEGDSALDTAINLTDETTFWSGIGTTVGGAIGGPIAGAVVGGLMGAGSKIGNALAEHIENKLDPFEEAVNDFKESTAKQLSDDESQLNSMLSTLSKYENVVKKNDKNQMKMLLMEEASMSAKELQNKTDEELQKLFMNNLVTQQENLAREKEQQVTLDRILNDNAQVTKELEQDFIGTALTQYGTAFSSMSDADKSEYIKSNINQFVGQSKDIIADVGSQISSMSDSDIDAYLLTMGVNADELKKMKPDDKRKELHERFVKEYSEKSNFTEETAALFERAMSDYEERRKTYVSSEKTFQEQWEAAKELTGMTNPEVSDIMIAYMDKYHGGGSWGDDVKDIIVNSDGTATLDPGNLYRSAYAFATGLTEVPSDNYPALLHKGERVLTKEESRAYNEMSSFAVSNLINTFNDGVSSSNVFSTTSYGIDFDKSIGTQTDVISKKLDQVISAIEKLNISLGNTSRTSSASYQNVVRGNSNITQLNTL